MRARESHILVPRGKWNRDGLHPCWDDRRILNVHEFAEKVMLLRERGWRGGGGTGIDEMLEMYESDTEAFDKEYWDGGNGTFFFDLHSRHSGLPCEIHIGLRAWEQYGVSYDWGLVNGRYKYKDYWEYRHFQPALRCALYCQNRLEIERG